MEEQNQINQNPEQESQVQEDHKTSYDRKATPHKGNTPLFIGLAAVLIIVGGLYWIFLQNNNIKESDAEVKMTQTNDILKVKTEDNPDTANTEALDVDKEEVFKKLTDNAWCTKPSGSRFAETTYNYQLKSDGTFKYSHVSDYPEANGTGAWNFEMRDKYNGHIFLSTGEMLHFKFLEEDSIVLRNLNLKKCEALPKSSNVSEQSLPSIREAQILNDIRANSWYRTNSQNLEFVPTKVTFTNDGRILSEYRYGECTEEVYMSIDPKDDFNGIVQYPVNDDTKNCDNRNEGTIGPATYGGVSFIDDLLRIRTDTYSSSDARNTGREIIGSLPGYSEINIKVEYDKPIVAGVPVKFYVEITNHLESRLGNMTLQRFSITKEYPGLEYREHGDKEYTVHAVDEISAVDLEGISLKEKEKYSFDFAASFESLGEQRVYLNALMHGRTQQWDTFYGISLDVAEASQ